MSTKKNLTFEESLARLETLVDEMEQGDLSLDKMVSYFEEGSGLVESCSKRLTEVEQKIEKLVKQGSAISPEPFEPENDDEK